MGPYPAGVYRFNTNPVEEKERAAEATLYGLGPYLGARVALQQSPILRAGR